MTAEQTIGVLGVSARAAAFSVLRAGYRPLAADAFADADLRRVANVRRVADYPAGLAAWLAQQAASRPGLRWFYTGGLENHPKVLARMQMSGQLLGAGATQAAHARSPFRLTRLQANAEWDLPETRRSPAGLPTDGTWLKKKRRSAGGSGVSLWRGGPPALGYYYQRRIDGISASAVYIGHRDGAVCYGVTRQLIGAAWTGAQGFAYCGTIGPWPVSDRVRSQIEQIGDRVATAFKLDGLFGVDFVLADDTAWVVEINPRYTASVEILERVATIPAITMHLAACRGQRVTVPDTETRCHGKAILYAPRDVRIDAALAERLLAEAGDWHSPEWADIPPAGTAIPAGRPVLTAFASATTCEEVEEKIKGQLHLLRDRL